MHNAPHFTLLSHSPEQTAQLGHTFAALAHGGMTVALIGPLGAGKTHLTQGIAEGLGINEPITSPTFLLHKTYEGRLRLHHFDFYRLESEDDLESIGFYDFQAQDRQSIIVVEWAEKFPRALEAPLLVIEIAPLAGSSAAVGGVSVNQLAVRQGLINLINCIRQKTGIPAAMHRDDLGDISFYWGDPGTLKRQFQDGSGISHILARRHLEGDNPSEVLQGVIETLAMGKISREYGGDQGRINIEHGLFEAVLSKQRFGKKETWLLTGFRNKSDAHGVSYIPKGYAPPGSVSRRAVVADLIKILRHMNEQFKIFGGPENLRRIVVRAEGIDAAWWQAFQAKALGQ